MIFKFNCISFQLLLISQVSAAFTQPARWSGQNDRYFLPWIPEPSLCSERFMIMQWRLDYVQTWTGSSAPKEGEARERRQKIESNIKSKYGWRYIKAQCFGFFRWARINRGNVRRPISTPFRVEANRLPRRDITDSKARLNLKCLLSDLDAIQARRMRTWRRTTFLERRDVNDHRRAA